jgi:hypothetical protein
LRRSDFVYQPMGFGFVGHEFYAISVGDIADLRMAVHFPSFQESIPVVHDKRHVARPGVTKVESWCCLWLPWEGRAIRQPMASRPSAVRMSFEKAGRKSRKLLTGDGRSAERILARAANAATTNSPQISLHLRFSACRPRDSRDRGDLAGTRRGVQELTIRIAGSPETSVVREMISASSPSRPKGQVSRIANSE